VAGHRKNLYSRKFSMLRVLAAAAASRAVLSGFTSREFNRPFPAIPKTCTTASDR